MNNKTNVALYLRTRNHSNVNASSPEQLRVMREFALAHNFNVVKEYIDDLSRGYREKAILNSLMANAEKKEFEKVLIYSMTRMPMCIKDFCEWCRKLEELNINVVSTADERFDSGSDAGKWIIGFMSFITDSIKFENECWKRIQFRK